MTKKLAMPDLPLKDRPYEKLEMFGETALSEAELLAILICNGQHGLSALDIAQLILSRYPKLRDLCYLSLEELKSFPGIGRSKALRIKAAFELGRRAEYWQKNEVNPQILSSEDAIKLMEEELVHLEQEEFHILLLNIKGRLIRQEKISRGGLNSTSLHPRDIFRLALRHNAASIILCHNHPSGESEPSPEDIKASRLLMEMGEKLGIRVLDHIIIARRGSTSLKSLNLF